MPVSEKQLEYAKKYQSGFDDIKIRVPKGKREEWRNEAVKHNKSLNQFVIDCVEDAIKKSTL